MPSGAVSDSCVPCAATIPIVQHDGRVDMANRVEPVRDHAEAHRLLQHEPDVAAKAGDRVVTHGAAPGTEPAAMVGFATRSPTSAVFVRMKSMAGPEIRTLDRETLPVFQLRDADSDALAAQVAQAVLDVSLPRASPEELFGTTVRYRMEGGHLDWDTRTGSIWAAKDQLWRVPSLDADSLAGLSTAFPAAPADAARVEALARLLAAASDYDGVTLKVEPKWKSGSRLVVWRRAGAKASRAEYCLDRTESLHLTLTSSKHALAAVPLSGSGAGFGGRSAIDGGWLGFSAAVPHIEKYLGEFATIPRDDLYDELRDTYAGVDILVSDVTLSYRVHDAHGTRILLPFWTFEVVAAIGGRSMPIGLVPVPAVAFPLPILGSLPTAPAPRLANGSIDWGASAAEPRLLLSWLGKRKGAPLATRGSRDRVAALIQAAGWTYRDCGDEDADERDWHARAASGVNQADIACYLGHATGEGMTFSVPSDEWLDHSECHFGDRLKWVLIDACGPLRDTAAHGAMSAFKYWAPAFDGLRSLLGFGSLQEPGTEHLCRTLQYALSTAGQPIAKAWFQSACETQRSCTNRGQPAWAAGLFAVDGNLTTIEDRVGQPPTPTVGIQPGVMAGVWIPLA